MILLIASTILIANTIRLSIFSRRREIEVMKLVGASNWFVRGPFMLEGLICGLDRLRSLAVILLVLAKELALPVIDGHSSTFSEDDVQAWSFPVWRSSSSASRLARRRRRLRHHAAALSAGLRRAARGPRIITARGQ